MFMLCQTSVKMAILLHKQASDWFHSLLTVSSSILILAILESVFDTELYFEPLVVQHTPILVVQFVADSVVLFG